MKMYVWNFGGNSASIMADNLQNARDGVLANLTDLIGQEVIYMRMKVMSETPHTMNAVEPIFVWGA